MRIGGSALVKIRCDLRVPTEQASVVFLDTCFGNPLYGIGNEQLSTWPFYCVNGLNDQRVFNINASISGVVMSIV